MAEPTAYTPVAVLPSPGRVRGEWDPDVMYVKGDLVCVRHIYTTGGGQPADSWYVSLKKSTNCHPERGGAAAEYWEPSPWVNVTEEFTQPEYRYQRIHSIHPEMIDEYILGKGIPAWYYFDMLGFFGTRTKILNVVDLLTTMRGTILGARSFLNLVNLESDLTRLAPEERYFYPDSDEPGESVTGYDDRDLSRERAWRNYMDTAKGYWSIKQADCSLEVKLARFWNDYTDYNSGDLVYYNIYSADEYAGCAVYKALRSISANEAGHPEPSGARTSTEAWDWVCSYEIRPMTALQMPSNTDNSRYGLLISQLAGRDAERVGGKIMIRDPFWQQIYSCYLSRLIDFLIPAWIRIESEAYLMDIVTAGGIKHTSSVNILMRPDFEGVEPHTLTVLPYIDEVGKVTSATGVAAVDGSGAETALCEIEKTGRGFIRDLPGGGYEFVSLNRMDAEVLRGEICGYFWYEPYMPEQYGENAKTLKIKVRAFQKLRLRSRVAGNAHYFWRWSLLNSYHYLPRFRVAGRTSERRWRDLEPTQWSSWEATTWAQVSGNTVYSTYSSCAEG